MCSDFLSEVSYSFEVMQDGGSYDLRGRQADHIAVMTGTFDPPHEGHIALGKKVLDHGPGLFLFYPHSRTPGKTPAPLEVREELLLRWIAEDSRMGVLRYTGQPTESVREFFGLLQEYRPCAYGRVIGADRARDALEERLDVPHYVGSRSGIQLELPEGWTLIPLDNHISSSDIRAGKRPMPSCYEGVEINELYPGAVTPSG